MPDTCLKKVFFCLHVANSHLKFVQLFYTHSLCVEVKLKLFVVTKGGIFWIGSIHFPQIFVEYPYLKFLARINSDRILTSSPIYSHAFFNTCYQKCHCSLMLVTYSARFPKFFQLQEAVTAAGLVAMDSHSGTHITNFRVI